MWLTISTVLLSCLLWSCTTASFYAEVSHSVAEKYNLICVKIMHRPATTKGLVVVSDWLKDRRDSSWRTIGVASIRDRIEMDQSPYQCLYVVVANHSSSQDFAQYTKSISLHQAVWVVFIDTSIDDFVGSAELPFSLELLAVRSVNDTFADVWDVSRVDATRPVRVRPVGVWTAERGVQLVDGSLYERRSDLEGITLRVGLIENWPISYQVKSGNTVKWDGLFLRIWRYIEQTINSSSSVHIRYTSTGSPRADGSWSGLIGMAVKGEIDVIVSELSINERRSHVLDFSHPLLTSKYQIYFKQPGIVLDWGAVLKPFPWPLWKAILWWTILSSAGLYLTFLISVKFDLEKRPNPAYPTYGYLSFLFFTIQGLSQQGREDAPRSSALRILFFSSYLVSAVVIPAYSASLISSLTQKTPYRPFNSVHEMLHDGTYKLLVANNTAEYDYFADTKDATLSQAYNRLITTVPQQHVMTSMGQAFQTICNQPKYALFGIEAIVSRRMTYQAQCQIISMTRPLSSVHLGMALPKNHPLQPLINYQLGLMIERGILERITMNVWPPVTPTAPELWGQVRLEEVFQMFAFLASAIGFSIIIFIAEGWVDRRRHPVRPTPNIVVSDCSKYQYQFIN